MKFYFAPLEGVAGYVYRNAHHMFFGGMDKYFSPFIHANLSDSFKTRDIRDILPEHNRGLFIVPQLLTNKADEFIHTAKRIRTLGYEEINLNLGCPSGTVVSKYRGAGFLAKKEELNRFLDEIYSKTDMKISIKTRIGKDDPDEFYELIEIFNQYPVYELIIHPRTQKDFYNNKPNMKIFKDALAFSKNPVCYNGDLKSVNDFHKFFKDYPQVDTVMAGRGLLTNPGLVQEVKYGRKPDKKTLKDFHDKILDDYRQVLSGDHNVLFKMKELWSYMIHLFADSESYEKEIKKSKRLLAYVNIVDSLFQNLDLITD